jgi:hypothetical protein
VKYFLGAYASSPNVSGWDEQLETPYYQALKGFDNVKGLKHPFLGILHAHDYEWFLENIDPRCEYKASQQNRPQ